MVTKEKSYSLSRDVESEKETKNRYIHYGDIHTGIADKIVNKNQLPFIKEDSYEPLLKGDLILADASEDYQGIATPAIILETTKYRIVAGLHTIVLRPSDKCDSLYLYYLLKTKSFKRYGYRMGTGMKVFGITANNVLAFKTFLPPKKEQYRISQLLKIMDRLLALQQRKHDLLKKLKQGYLQQMFPSKDAVSSQSRFQEFSSNWQEYRLGEIAEIVGGGTPSTGVPEYWDGDIDWYSPAEIGESIYVTESLKKITESGLKKSSAKMLPIGTILFTSRAGIGNTAILAKEGSTNQGFQSIVPKKNILDSYFIFSRTSELKKYGEVTGAGSTFIEVSGKQMAQMPIRIPYFEEQKKIGIFFAKLDDNITLQQSKINILNKLKQAYLQKLFP